MLKHSFNKVVQRDRIMVHLTPQTQRKTNETLIYPTDTIDQVFNTANPQHAQGDTSLAASLKRYESMEVVANAAANHT
jgi:hypothetical protein